MKLIPLDNGQNTIVDDEEYDWLPPTVVRLLRPQTRRHLCGDRHSPAGGSSWTRSSWASTRSKRSGGTKGPSPVRL